MISQSNSKPKSSLQVGVVGGGLGGLAAACVLAARGHRVHLFEKNPWLGGKAAEYSEGGYRFDMGPTILTLPGVLTRIFAEAGKNVSDYLQLVPLDPQWRCFYEDGTALDLLANVEKMCESLKDYATTPDTSTGYAKFLQMSEKLHEISNRFFFWKSVGGLMDTFQAGGMFDIKVLKDVMSLRMGRSVATVVRQHVPDPRVAQMIDHFTQYVGSAPDASPAVLCGIAHMQTSEGVWYPMGGTRAVPVALTKLATELGVEFHCECDITAIETSGVSVTGVRTDRNEFFPLDAVVSNCDALRTHRELLRGTPNATALDRGRDPACSGVVLYLGLKERYDHLLHHNFVFSKDPHEEFEWIYRRGEPAPDPTCYVCAPAATEAAVAPPGGEALYVLVHTPYLRPHHDWDKMLPEYRDVILDKLERTGKLSDIRSRIVVERSLTPAGIDSRYRVWRGAIYGLASHGKFLGAFKPANRHRKVNGLYLAGGAAHPGPGMPMVMMSGWIAADAVDTDSQKGRIRNLTPAST